jgi:hypothetical protein
MTKSRKLPWCFDILGIVLGALFMITPLIIALYGNYQFKHNKDTRTIENFYIIVLVLNLVVVIPLFIYGLVMIGIVAVSR